MTRLLIGLLILAPSAAVAQYYGGANTTQPRRYTPTYTPQSPTYQPQRQNGPTVIRQNGQPKLCNTYGGVTTCP